MDGADRPAIGHHIQMEISEGESVTKLSEEARAVAAASLVQAHAAILGGVYAGRRQGANVSVIPQELIEKLFTHYLGVVERDPKALTRKIEVDDGL